MFWDFLSAYIRMKANPVALLVPLPHQPCCFLPPFTASLLHSLSFAFAFKHVNVSLMLPYETSHTSHLLPSLLLLLLFLPPLVFQPLEHTVPWHTFSCSFPRVRCIYSLLAVWASCSTLSKSWAQTAWSSMIKATCHSFLLRGRSFYWAEMEFTSESAKLIPPPFSLLHRSRD